MVARRQGECNFHEVAVQFTPAAIGVTGYRRARKEGRKERGDRKGERERGRRGRGRGRKRTERERERVRGGGGARTRKHTYVHEERRRSVVCQVRPVT